MKHIPNIAVVISLVLVAYELNQNRESLIESNNLTRIESSNNAFVGSTAVRESIIANIDVWQAGQKLEILDEREEEIFSLLCENYMFNLTNLWEADYYSGNQEKLISRLRAAEVIWGTNVCYHKYTIFREEFLSRGEIYSSLVEALDKGASGWKEERH